MKILTIVGARPQFVKAAVVSKAFQSLGLAEEIVHTGQHYDPLMNDVFFKELGIPEPVVNLHIGSGTHGYTTAEMLKGIEKEIIERKPDWVLVYGDTNSTLAGALAAAKLNVRVAHVEAGQRSFDRAMPEEVNRVITDHVSSLLFCCAPSNVELLKKEGITENVINVGDVMFDAFRMNLEKATWPLQLERPKKAFALATIHRAANTDVPGNLAKIFKGLSLVDAPVILPLHPRTRKILKELQIEVSSNVSILDPVSYHVLLAVLQACQFVITDSGGLQKEAYYAGKPGIVLREETEWAELVELGATRLVGVSPDRLRAATEWASRPFEALAGVYGDGHSAVKIAKAFMATAKN